MRFQASVLTGRAGQAGTASLVGAAKSAPLHGRAGQAGTASLVGAAKSAP
jgi:hypothetical protein